MRSRPVLLQAQRPAAKHGAQEIHLALSASPLLICLQLVFLGKSLALSLYLNLVMATMPETRLDVKGTRGIQVHKLETPQALILSVFMPKGFTVLSLIPLSIIQRNNISVAASNLTQEMKSYAFLVFLHAGHSDSKITAFFYWDIFFLFSG